MLGPGSSSRDLVKQTGNKYQESEAKFCKSEFFLLKRLAVSKTDPSSKSDSGDGSGTFPVWGISLLSVSLDSGNCLVLPYCGPASGV